MTIANVSQQNFVSGELSPSMRSRIDLPIYGSGCERMVNFISEVAGPARFRNGTQFMMNTRRNKIANLLPFQFNDSQAYDLEFTDGYIRFFSNDEILVEAAKPITAITQGNPIQVTVNGHGYTTGDEILISEVVGMKQLNNRSLIVSVLNADIFNLLDQDELPLNGTHYDAYLTGGITEKVYEVQSPYDERDLFGLKVAQNADTQYIVSRYYEQRKFVRSGALSWSLSLFTRVNDPFTSKKTITGITQAIPAVVTSVAHGYSNGNEIIIETVVGMTQVNGKVFRLANVTTDTFQLLDRDGNQVNSLVYGVYVSGGYASNRKLLPGAVAFYQGRVLYANSDLYPESFWGSKALDASGNPQYDDFTVGTNAADSFKFTISPATGKVDIIEDLIPTTSFLGICTFEGVYKADGGTQGQAITPSNINVVPAVMQGVLQTVKPYLLGINLYFFHRTGLILYSLEYDIFYNAYNAVDKNLSNDHLTESGVKQMVFQNGRPPLFWMVRNDGKLLAATTVVKENINGWNRHPIGGTASKVISANVRPRVNKFDRLTLVIERQIQGKTRRYVEYMNDPAVIPESIDYYTGDLNQESDLARWRRAMFEAQKQYIHLDSTLTYDGRYAPQYAAVETVCT